MGSWVRRITSPFRKAKAAAAHLSISDSTTSHSRQETNDHQIRTLRGEVMACGYEDVHVMWSILDKSTQTTFK